MVTPQRTSPCIVCGRAGGARPVDTGDAAAQVEDAKADVEPETLPQVCGG